jgi:hypothetical protein
VLDQDLCMTGKREARPWLDGPTSWKRDADGYPCAPSTCTARPAGRGTLPITRLPRYPEQVRSLRPLLSALLLLAPSIVSAQRPATSQPADSARSTAYEKLAKDLEAFLRLRPDLTSAFFARGKSVIDRCDSFVTANVQPQAVCALCLEAKAIDHLTRFESRLSKSSVKWLHDTVGGSFAYRAVCEGGTASRGIDIASTCFRTRTPQATPHVSSTIPGCRPADLLVSSERPATWRRCEVFARAEVQRLLRDAHRKFKRKQYQVADALVGNAFAIAPEWTEVRRARAFTKAAIRDMGGALREVSWWRETLGDEAADQLLDDIQRIPAIPTR